MCSSHSEVGSHQMTLLEFISALNSNLMVKTKVFPLEIDFCPFDAEVKWIHYAVESHLFLIYFFLLVLAFTQCTSNSGSDALYLPECLSEISV